MCLNCFVLAQQRLSQMSERVSLHSFYCKKNRKKSVFHRFLLFVIPDPKLNWLQGSRMNISKNSFLFEI